MRYTSDHKEKTRIKILEAAATLFRRQGFHATGVDKVMAEAGLTPGGFYAHFDSKDSLLAETLEHFAQSTGTTLLRGLTDCSDAGTDSEFAHVPASEKDSARAMIDRYLAAAHCAQPDKGCPIPTLAAEVCRAGEAPRRVFERLIARLIARMKAQLRTGEKESSKTKQEDAIAMIALCVGGITMARAVANPEFADEILAACRAFAHKSLDHRSPGERKENPRKAAR